MKRLGNLIGLLCIIFAMNIVTLHFFGQLPMSSAGTGAEVGDVNDDGSVDLADAISILAYLYQDGPELVACAQEQTTPFVSIGVAADTTEFGTAEYLDSDDMHEDESDTIVLTPGTWIVGMNVGNRGDRCWELRLNDEVHKTYWNTNDVPKSQTTLIQVSEDTDLTFVGIISGSYTMAADGDEESIFDFVTYKRCELWAVRIAE